MTGSKARAPVSRADATIPDLVPLRPKRSDGGRRATFVAVEYTDPRRAADDIIRSS